jgi:hypothetical protein
MESEIAKAELADEIVAPNHSPTTAFDIFASVLDTAKAR